MRFREPASGNVSRTRVTNGTGSAPLDPQMAVVVEAMRAAQASAPPFADIPVATMRARAKEQFAFWNAEPPPVSSVRELDVPGHCGLRRVRVYEPLARAASRGALVYFHGGGWVIGDLDLEDCALRHLANDSGAVIFSADYVLAPEHKFPAPVLDCVAVTEWLQRHAAESGFDPGRLAVGGASAGANLALATALTVRERRDSSLRFMLLFYGVYAADHSTTSHRMYGGGDFVLSSAMMERFWTLYLEDARQAADPRAAPLHADLTGLPPAYLCAAELDPLRDDSLALTTRLRAAGVRAECKICPGVVHGFTLMSRSVPAARRALQDAGAALRDALAR